MDQLLQTLIELYLRDIAMFTKLTTHWYHWIWLGPFWYLCVFVTKWFVLTLPAWLPVVLILGELPCKK